MEVILERRREQRLTYQWPVWFAEDFNEVLSQGQMVDISSSGAAFTCFAGKSCPRKGQKITARFSIPVYDSDENYDVNNYIMTGSVCRIEKLKDGFNRVAIQFSHSLPIKPGEQSNSCDYETMYEAALV